ncbi:BglG family transcription antiterminator [Brevibacillus parabrevis]|uniref:BglG family transcription antiterminator n=1 Tax=Brevibacillus parabrevis TaxID=54914 RepID=UPI0023800CE5|nr:BglG family transcription antiterminator [Brevibacillus parabrevis]WDV95186.1 BglG family transcription antiterminator [Brevibacillus parabrevis]
MQVSSRQRSIMEILLQEEKGITVAQIAERIGVSTRTVHRELDALAPLFAKNELELVRKTGAGVEVAGTAEQKLALKMSVLHQTTTEFTAEERKAIIMCSLLAATEPVKLISLAIDLKVTTATISHDLDDLEELLGRYDLTLLRKRGYGVELLGNEASKRRAISRLIAEHLDDHELIGVIKENIQNKTTRDMDSISRRLLSLIDRDKLIKVENALSHLEAELPYPLADSAYIGLVAHLALAIERIEKGEKIRFDEHTWNELIGTPEFVIAENIMERLRHIFQMEIPRDEIGYITMHLRGAKLRHSHDDYVWPENTELAALTGRFIALCEERLGLSLRDDSSLFHGLLTHLEPALYRLRRKMEIHNPILGQIKQNYPELFAVAKEAMAALLPELPVPDEEIGYLVMHLGAALERGRQEQQRYRALVVCSSGIGSSKILATRIKKEIPEIVSLKNLSMFDVGSVPRSDYDLIISTLPLSFDPAEYVVVSPLLPQDDIQKIKFHLHNRPVQVESMKKSKGMPPKGKQAQAQLKSMQFYAAFANQIIDGLRQSTVSNVARDMPSVLHDICSELEQRGAIYAVDPVVQQLIEREKLGGLGIPGTAMALFHGRNEAVTTASFTIHFLEQPVRLRSMDEEEMSVDLLLLLLGPKEVPKEGLEVLSEVSSLLIEEEMQELLKTGEIQHIADYIAGKLYAFCLKKTGWERV